MLPEQLKVYEELAKSGFWAQWISGQQRNVLRTLIRGEEAADYYVSLLNDLKARIESMPVSYQTNGYGNNAIVYLHYFRGNVDSWITERDVGDEDDTVTQNQAYGRQSFHGPEDADKGYISIQELIENNVEIDLHWTPKPSYVVFSEPQDILSPTQPADSTESTDQPSPPAG